MVKKFQQTSDSPYVMLHHSHLYFHKYYYFYYWYVIIIIFIYSDVVYGLLYITRVIQYRSISLFIFCLNIYFIYLLADVVCMLLSLFFRNYLINGLYFSIFLLDALVSIFKSIIIKWPFLLLSI